MCKGILYFFAICAIIMSMLLRRERVDDGAILSLAFAALLIALAFALP